MQEVWKDIAGYEGRYQISNLGNVKSLIRTKERILKSHLDIHGYPVIPLRDNGKTKNYFVHRLVATAFIDNPDNLPVVNHIDGNKKNPHISNLEWCSYAENHAHALRTGLIDLEYNNKRFREGMKSRRDWHKGHKFYQVAFSLQDDADCLKVLQGKEDVAAYIKQLIRKDIGSRPE